LHKRRLGGSGVEVSAIGLGAMPLSLAGRPPEEAAIEVIRAYVEGGGNFIDTANVYCLDTRDVGHNERLIRKALERLGRVDEVFVATKGGLTKEGSGWDPDGRPAWLRTSCERSLRDLRTDCLFLYQLHAPDPMVPLADSVGELARLRAEGKIRHIGLSNVNGTEIGAVLKIAPIVSVQNKCHVLMQKSFRNGVVDLCRAKGIAFIPHSPVGGHGQGDRMTGSRVIVDIAAKHRASPQQVALAWLLARGEHIIPIPGASRTASVRSSLEAERLRLDAEDLEALNRLAA
jgi:aryl-alcohol dehydrogenase-like predicted oxidoreductase